MNLSPEIKEEISHFLKKNNTAVIATVFKGEPYASTVHYISDDDLNIYFLAHRNTSKYLNVSSHQWASIVIGTGPNHISVQARGRIDLLVDSEVKRIFQTFKWLKESHLVEHWPIEEMKKFEGKEPVAFKFEPSEMTFMNLDDADYPHSKGKDYYQVI